MSESINKKIRRLMYTASVLPLNKEIVSSDRASTAMKEIYFFFDKAGFPGRELRSSAEKGGVIRFTHPRTNLYVILEPVELDDTIKEKSKIRSRFCSAPLFPTLQELS